MTERESLFSAPHRRLDAFVCNNLSGDYVAFSRNEARELVEDFDRCRRVLAEIAVDVKLAEDLPPETQIAALWQVVRRHTGIAKEAL